MQLALPATAAGVERQVIEVDPRTILLLQGEPQLIALLGGHLRVLIHLVLEFIYHAAIRDKDQGVLAVAQLVLIGLLAEEEVMPGGG